MEEILLLQVYLFFTQKIFSPLLSYLATGHKPRVEAGVAANHVLLGQPATVDKVVRKLPDATQAPRGARFTRSIPLSPPP